MAHIHPRSRERILLGALICFHIVAWCVSLVYVAAYRLPIEFDPSSFHIFYEPSRLHIAVLVILTFSVLSLVFVVSNFSFGYFVGFYFYTMVLGYLWIGCFSDLNYDHRLAGLSAAASATAFLLPALFIVSPLRQAFVLSAAAFDMMLTFILAFAVVVVMVGAGYNFRLVGILDIYELREKMGTPTILNYLLGMTSSALLPFAFAGFAARKAYGRAGAVLLLLLFFYPITFTKTALFSPAWLVCMLLLSKLTEARIAVVLSLLVPILVGLIVIALLKQDGALYFTFVNLRIGAIPSVAMDVYHHFFSTNDSTYFCQISILKPVLPCPYPDQLSLVMERAYKLGNFNASLFATEGVASVGALFAPVAVFACGLVIALGNRLSAGLPAGFILLSGAVLPQVLLNVPLTTVLLTHGGGLLFLLWYITPRAIFEKCVVAQAPAGQDRLIAMT
jgi:hypothetical protein